MTTETLYKPRGAGHNVPDGERRNYLKPGDKLLEAFLGWLDRIPFKWEGPASGQKEHPEDIMYKWALEMMPDLTGVTGAEINSLLIHNRKDHPQSYFVGVFLSAAYNKSDMKGFVFDSDAGGRINSMGFRLAAGKNLILWEDTNTSNGTDNGGTIINYGESFLLGVGNSGTVINFGLAHQLGDGPGLEVDYGQGRANQKGEEYDLKVKSGKYDDEWKDELLYGTLSPKIVLKLLSDAVKARQEPERLFIDKEGAAMVPGLHEYLTNLKDRLSPERPYSDVLAELENLDAGTDIRRLINKWGKVKA